MGQRLNMEIRKKGKVLANAYYHWSGYTGSAYEIASQVIDYIELNKNMDSRMLAIRALESTGAGICDDDKDYLKSFRKYHQEQVNKMIDRNAGILSISPKTIAETQQWAEGTCILEIDNLQDIKVSFDVLCIYDSQEDYEHNYLDDDEFEITKFRDNLETIDYDVFDMSLTQFDNLCSALMAGKYFKDSEGRIFSEFG